MQTHEIHVSGAREQVHEIRGELFAFPEVIEVFVTGRSDRLVVVYAGRPRPGEWLRALRAIGFRTPARGHSTWQRRSEVLLRTVVGSPNAGVDDGDGMASSVGKQPAPRGRRDAA